MWLRKRLDIGWSDLTFGILACCRPLHGAAIERRIERHWSCADDAIACLSVRSGFDLLLGALELPPKSEVLISAITISDMVRIVEDRGLVAVPVDLDLSTMAPPAELLRRSITPATRAIVVAHLFGGRAPVEPILATAKEHGLLLIEDCAQAFAGGEYRGHPEADASMFSFGPIKTATALGGAVLRVRDGELLRRMRAQQEGYPVQSRWFYLRRLLKYAALKSLSPRPTAAAVILSCRAIHFDYDRMLNGAVRGFAGPSFFPRIRQCPSPPLLAVLYRRLRSYNSVRLAKRTAGGALLAEQLGAQVRHPGADLAGHTYWVFPIVADDPGRVVAALREAGFDATQGQSLCVVAPPAGRPECQARVAEDALAKIVFLPIYPEMKTSALRRMARAVLRTCGNHRAVAESDCRPCAAASTEAVHG